MLSSLMSRFTRRKQLDVAASSSSSLARVLITTDLTLLGVGSTLGVGVYVLAEGVARDTAGHCRTLRHPQLHDRRPGLRP